jgi:REP element-mobilizing transposase RayT
MTRQLRHLQSGWHHVTNRGIDRDAVFRSPDDRIDFGRLLASGHDRFEVSVLAYCLLDNHFHLVLSCPSGGLSEFMQHVSANFTRRTNERHGGDGPVFRSRFSSRPVLSERYLANAVRYVHRNPLDVRPVVQLEQFRWSSHRTYVGLRRVPAWMSTAPVLEWFESADAFHAFVIDDLDVSDPISAPAADLFHACEAVIDMLSGDLGQARNGVLRTVAYLLLDRVDDRTRSELLRHLSPTSVSAREQAVKRARRAAAANPIYAEIVARTLDLIATPFTWCQTRPERRCG